MSLALMTPNEIEFFGRVSEVLLDYHAFRQIAMSTYSIRSQRGGPAMPTSCVSARRALTTASYSHVNFSSWRSSSSMTVYMAV